MNQAVPSPQNTITAEEMLTIIAEQTIAIRRLNQALGAAHKKMQALTPKEENREVGERLK